LDFLNRLQSYNMPVVLLDSYSHRETFGLDECWMIQLIVAVNVVVIVVV